tara:strand:+ start:418 stop:654 length:237 start_codon:yes stop_codon:yes gene_type:complete
MKQTAKNIKLREKLDTTYFITNKDNTENYLVNCTKDELNEILLDFDFEDNEFEVFKYKSDEYYMYLLGEDYDVNKIYD